VYQVLPLCFKYPGRKLEKRHPPFARYTPLYTDDLKPILSLHTKTSFSRSDLINNKL